MSNKVKVSHEVAEALKDLLSRSGSVYSKEWILQNHCEAIKDGDKWSGDRWQHLNKLTITEMAQAIFIGYEAEPQYNVGDWVVREDGEYFKSGSIAAKITELHFNRLILEGQLGSYTYEYIRHATKEEIKLEKERLFWKSIGREVGEFEDGDVITKVCGKSYVVERKPDEGQSKEWYEQGNLKGFYPVESFVKFEESW